MNARNGNISDPDEWETWCNVCETKQAPLLKIQASGCGCEASLCICAGCARHLVKMFDDAEVKQ